MKLRGSDARPRTSKTRVGAEPLHVVRMLSSWVVVCHGDTDLDGRKGVSENRGPEYSTLNSRILILRTPKIRYPLFSESPL